jgi:hypothetical protein
MTPTPARNRRRSPLKSPLALAGGYASPGRPAIAETADPALPVVALSDREATLAEFEDYLQTTNNRDGRP